MKIAFFHELEIGGARRSVNEYANELKKKHKIDLFFVDEDYFGKEDKSYNRTYFFKFKPKFWYGGNWKAKIYKDTIELFNLYKLHKKIAFEINKGKYDAVIVNPSKYTQSPFILRFIKVKKIYYCQETLRFAYEPLLTINRRIGLFKYFYETFNRFVRKNIDLANIKKADSILTNSKNTKKNINKNYHLFSEVCYLGVDTNFFKPGNLEKDIDVLFIGSDEFMDGFNLVKDALAKMKHKVNLKTTIDKKRKDINDEKLLELYRRAKIVVCTARDEPFGMIPLEAMAVGTLVIAVNEGGYKESIIDKSNGFLVERNSLKLAQKIDWVLNNSEEAKKITKNARQIVISEWNWEKRTKELENMLTKILNNTKLHNPTHEIF